MADHLEGQSGTLSLQRGMMDSRVCSVLGGYYVWAVTMMGNGHDSPIVGKQVAEAIVNSPEGMGRRDQIPGVVELVADWEIGS